MLSRENALSSPYQLTSIQKDYEKILITLARLEKKMEEKGTLHYAPNDTVGRAGKLKVEDKLQEAMKRKSVIDGKFVRISTAASAAKAKVEG